MRGGWVYILTNKPNGTLYIGVTNDLPRRIHEHRTGAVSGFTKRYDLKLLVYAERHDGHPGRDQARADHEDMASCVESAADSRRESRMGRPFGLAALKKTWLVARAAELRPPSRAPRK
jgi:hypothetical protein